MSKSLSKTVKINTGIRAYKNINGMPNPKEKTTKIVNNN
jgi:hypothetical protein